MRRFALAVAAAMAFPSLAAAAPAKLVILRHGEKADAWKLCGVGEMRAAALAAQWLGKGATPSLFDAAGPDAILAITLHTAELVSPAASSWGLPVTLYSAVPTAGQSKDDFTLALNRRTQEAARDLYDDAYDGSTVVMVWEHDHIADAALEARFPGEKVTLRQLLGLDALPGVPDTWPGATYDYFWIVTFDASSGAPSSFTMTKQEFAAPFADLPQNDWDAPDGLAADSGCEG